MASAAAEPGDAPPGAGSGDWLRHWESERTPLSNPKCTGRCRQLALTLKKHHGFHEDAAASPAAIVATLLED